VAVSLNGRGRAWLCRGCVVAASEGLEACRKMAVSVGVGGRVLYRLCLLWNVFSIDCVLCRVSVGVGGGGLSTLLLRCFYGCPEKSKWWMQNHWMRPCGPCIGSSRGHAGRCSHPRPGRPCTCSSGGYAGKCWWPHSWSFKLQSLLWRLC